MKDSILYCSNLQDKILELEKKVSEKEKIAEGDTNIRFNVAYANYIEAHNQLKYAKASYSYHCQFYDLFCKKFF